MKNVVLKFGLMATALLMLMQLTRYSLLTQNLENEMWVGLFAVMFLGFGVAIAMIYLKQKQPTLQTESVPSTAEIDHQKIKNLGISNREYEVLQLIAEGLSNQEIASRLFISQSTVKTHVSNLLSKLDAKRRTQALNIAKEMKII